MIWKYLYCNFSVSSKWLIELRGSNSQIKHILHGLEGGLPSFISIFHRQLRLASRYHDDNLQGGYKVCKDHHGDQRCSGSPLRGHYLYKLRADPGIGLLARSGASAFLSCKLWRTPENLSVRLDCSGPSISRGAKRHKLESSFGSTSLHLQHFVHPGSLTHPGHFALPCNIVRQLTGAHSVSLPS